MISSSTIGVDKTPLTRRIYVALASLKEKKQSVQSVMQVVYPVAFNDESQSDFLPHKIDVVD